MGRRGDDGRRDRPDHDGELEVTPLNFSPSSRGRLTTYDLARFPGDSLFDRLGRAVCEAGCLPRKELYESWELARRTRRLLRGGRVVDLGGGHGLLAHVMLLLDDSSPAAVVVDTAIPPSARAVQDALVKAWPRLSGRVALVSAALESFDVSEGDVVVSSHACGGLTDRVLDRAIAARARVAVLPCCHDSEMGDAGPLSGWLDSALAIDSMRAVRLAGQGYRVWTQTIPASITPKNRLLLAGPLPRP
jgi:SAM-dependent methyltransferase